MYPHPQALQPWHPNAGPPHESHAYQLRHPQQPSVHNHQATSPQYQAGQPPWSAPFRHAHGAAQPWSPLSPLSNPCGALQAQAPYLRPDGLRLRPGAERRDAQPPLPHEVTSEEGQMTGRGSSDRSEQQKRQPRTPAGHQDELTFEKIPNKGEMASRERPTALEPSASHGQVSGARGGHSDSNKMTDQEDAARRRLAEKARAAKKAKEAGLSERDEQTPRSGGPTSGLESVIASGTGDGGSKDGRQMREAEPAGAARRRGQAAAPTEDREKTTHPTPRDAALPQAAELRAAGAAGLRESGEPASYRKPRDLASVQITDQAEVPEATPRRKPRDIAPRQAAAAAGREGPSDRKPRDTALVPKAESSDASGTKMIEDKLFPPSRERTARMPNTASQGSAVQPVRRPAVQSDLPSSGPDGSEREEGRDGRSKAGDVGDKTVQRQAAKKAKVRAETLAPSTARTASTAIHEPAEDDPAGDEERIQKDVARVEERPKADRPRAASIVSPRSLGSSPASAAAASSAKDPFAGMLTSAARRRESAVPQDAAVQGASERENRVPDWSQALVSLAICINLGYTILQRFQAQAGGAHGDRQGAATALFVAVAKGLAGGGRSISSVVERISGDRSIGEGLERELGKLAVFVAHSPMLDARANDEEEAPGKTHRLIELLLSNGMLQNLLKDQPLAKYAQPGIIAIIRDLAHGWTKDELNLKIMLRSVMAIRKELKHPAQPQLDKPGVLDQLAILLNKQLKRQITAHPTDTPPGAKATDKLPTPERQARKPSEDSVQRARQQLSTTPKHPHPTLKPSKTRLATPKPTSPHPTDSSDSAYSASPPESPGTLESDDEADKMLAVADSGPPEHRHGDPVKRRDHRPGREQVRAAKEVLGQK